MEKSTIPPQKSDPVKSSENHQELTGAINDNSLQSGRYRQMKDLVQNGARTIAQRKTFSEALGPPPNNTGMPDYLKTGLEHLSGMDLSAVKVHYNSDKPAQLQAHAYAQGDQIYLGAGQEKHLPHEGWHVVQQRQGRVQPTLKMNGVDINDDRRLEGEADVMGKRALSSPQKPPLQLKEFNVNQQQAVVQRYIGKYNPEAEDDGAEAKTEAPRFTLDEVWNLLMNVDDQAGLIGGQSAWRDDVLEKFNIEKVKTTLNKVVTSGTKDLSLPNGQPNTAFVQLVSFIEKTMDVERKLWEKGSKRELGKLGKHRDTETLFTWCVDLTQYKFLISSPEIFNAWEKDIRPVETGVLMKRNFDGNDFDGYVEYCRKKSKPPVPSETKEAKKINSCSNAMHLWGNVPVSNPLSWGRIDTSSGLYWDGLILNLSGNDVGGHLSVHIDDRTDAQEVHFTFTGSTGIEGNYFADVLAGGKVNLKSQSMYVKSSKPKDWNGLGSNAQSQLKKLLMSLFFPKSEFKPGS
jgi:hypothetical protein